MISLKNIEILKYKSFTSPQSIKIEDDITVLVGMNESGKTSVLECLAKSNYFENDEKFKFDQTLDYPRKELKSISKSSESPKAIICSYKLSAEFFQSIENELGSNLWKGSDEITVATSYDGSKTIDGVKVDFDAFLQHQNLSEINNEIKAKLSSVLNEDHFNKLLEEFPDSSNDLEKLRKFFYKESKWANFIEAYIYRSIIAQHLPKFIYYDEYYQLPSRIVLEDFLNENTEITDDLKTAKALLDLAEININDLINAEDFEQFIAELEATEALISDTLFDYWSANQNLNIEFKIDKKTEDVQKTVKINHSQQTTVTDIKVIQHILDIRVKNSKTRVSLPLQNRSKGFNWFFSFLVWFNKIQADSNSQYILLLDEPGLNLHATAQADLLRFLESLVDRYQVIYTTHSPFMVETTKLNRVRTVFSDENSSVISESIQQKDPNTLFPLQAALGYDIAQNLFISKKNLLVEGVSDLLFLTTISEYLNAKQRTGLNEDITIVPTGGLEKVASFISLLRGSKLSIFCLLDSFTDQKAQAKFDSLSIQKIISEKNIRFFHNYLENRTKADIEDMFTQEEYLNLFNKVLSPTYTEIKVNDLDSSIEGILAKINKIIGKSRFNHYLPAKEFSNNSSFLDSLSDDTLLRFETIFKDVNKNLK